MHRQMLYLTKYMPRNKIEIDVCACSYDGGLTSQFEKTDSNLFHLNWQKTFDYKAIYKLYKLLSTKKPDIIFITEPVPMVYFLLVKPFLNIKINQIGSFRALTFWKGHLKSYYNAIDRILATILFRTSEIIVVNSKAMKKHYDKYILSRNKKNIKIVYNGIEFISRELKNNHIIRNSLNISTDKFVIVMLARLDPWKDFYTLFRSMEIISKCNKGIRLLLIGGGVLKKSLDNEISKRNLKKYIQILGEKTNPDDYLNMADVSVLSSHGEGFSNSIMESMALGKPVIATNIGGNAEILGKDGKYGLLFEEKNETDLANKIMYLMKNDKKRTKMGLDGMSRIQVLCEMDNYINQFQQLFMTNL
jgi:glycosyltransferase involved in cell wall biosynthesis